jgi:5-methylcytosine-specific restriction endonuclease McrA
MYRKVYNEKNKQIEMKKIRILQLRLDGLSYAEIGKRLNVSRQRIQQYFCPPAGVRELIRRRYNDKCADCGISVGEHGHIHHEGNSFETYTDTDNLYLLCISCHRKRHHVSTKTTDNIPDNYIEDKMKELKERCIPKKYANNLVSSK